MEPWLIMADGGSTQLKNSTRPLGYPRDLETITGRYCGYWGGSL